jgi:hydroxymethylpyrimidine/phosphomethylpyrimidine kinase
MGDLIPVMTISGSDSSAGAGLQLDLKVFAALGVWGTTVATALTAQNTRGVERVHHLPPRFVAAQIDALAADLRPAAVKTGMLGRAQVVNVVAERIRRRRLPNLVVDPVLQAKDGTPLLNPAGIQALKQNLLPLARVVTPNLPEAAALAGLPVEDDASLRAAARAIAALGPAVVIKGGHGEGDPVDLLFDGERFMEFGGARIEGPPVHGTGCLYSAALAARLVLGDSLPEACACARRFVEEAIRSAVPLGKGSRLAPVGVSWKEGAARC